MAISLTKGLYVFDLEADNLLDDVTKIHCLSVGKITKSGIKIMTTTDYDEMRDFFTKKDITKIGHNIIAYDCLVAEKILGIKVPTSNLIDTLPLSWYLYPDNLKHGLEYWGEVIGNSKVKIENWQNLPEDDYVNRCEVDVQINHALWDMQKEYLLKIYGSEEEAIRLIKYLNFKRLCVRDQEIIGVRFDKERAENAVIKLEEEKNNKLSQLVKSMPASPITSKKKKPKDMYKKDGSMTKKWQDWLQFKVEYGVPDDWPEDEVEYISRYKEANPQSTIQVKDWLFSLGWEPCTYSYQRNKETNEFKQIPQVYNKDTGEVTPSVKRLSEKEPAVTLLDGLGKLKHRIGLLNGMLRDCKEVEPGHYRLYPSISGYANTLRMQHKVITNLPKISLFMGDIIRGCLIADEGCTLASADLSNIEACTRNHYVYPYDKAYVEDMSRPDFDSHCDIAVLAGLITEEDANWFITTTKKIETDSNFHLDETEDKRYKEIKNKRGIAKTINFASVYGCSPKTMSRNTGMDVKFCAKLIDTYWQRNWAVKTFAESVVTKSVNGQHWAFNPISKLWYSLRSDKDRFSTINQSSACFTFDQWVKHIRKMGVKIIYQCHDELLFNIPKGEEDYYRELLQFAMNKTNEQLKLNVEIRQSPSFGYRYSECH